MHKVSNKQYKQIANAFPRKLFFCFLGSKDELRFILLYLVLGWTGCISMWANDHFSVIFKTV